MGIEATLCKKTPYVLVSQQLALSRWFQSNANNMASNQHTGFKASDVAIETYEEPLSQNASVMFASENGMLLNLQQGPLTPTDNPLDVALVGTGFLNLQGGLYTRNGQLQVTPEGVLAVSTGEVVADQGGAPITIPPTAKEISIAPNGSVSVDGVVIGQLGISDFPNKQLTKGSNGTFQANEPPQPALSTSVRQGSLEGSNQNMILSLADHQAKTTGYKQSEEALRQYYQMQRSAITKILRTN